MIKIIEPGIRPLFTRNVVISPKAPHVLKIHIQIKAVMKLFSTGQIAAIDRYTIEKEPVSDLDLMERAAEEMYYYLNAVLPWKQKLHFFAGTGNNGGDALVIARKFSEADYPCTVYLPDTGRSLSSSCSTNLERLRTLGKAEIRPIVPEAGFPALDPAIPVIEGLFGAGLTRPLSGFPAALVRHINQSGAPVYSIDLPAGLMGEDNGSNNPENIIKARETLTLQFPKISLLFPENEVYAGHVELIDIGLHPEALAITETPFRIADLLEIKALFPPRKKFTHKGTYGHALLVAGSYGMTGAAVLASRACHRSGTGLVTTHIPGSGYPILQISTPETMCSVDPHEHHFSKVPQLAKYSAIGIGPGLGTHPETRGALLQLLEEAKVPLVLDADALNMLAQETNGWQKIPPGTILTPHPGEFSRLFGDEAFPSSLNQPEQSTIPPSSFTGRPNSWLRLEKQRHLSQTLGVVIVLKGANTLVTLPDGNAVFNPTGNPGMATGGSGDVLTGIITGLLAQGFTPAHAAISGVYLHGLAGDLAARKITQPALIASDIVDSLGRAFREIFDFRQP